MQIKPSFCTLELYAGIYLNCFSIKLEEKNHNFRTKKLASTTCVCVSLSRVQLFATAWTVACQGPLSMEFSRQEYWSGLPLPSPGDLPAPVIESASLALAGRFFTIKPPGKSPKSTTFQLKKK